MMVLCRASNARKPIDPRYETFPQVHQDRQTAAANQVHLHIHSGGAFDIQLAVEDNLVIPPVSSSVAMAIFCSPHATAHAPRSTCEDDHTPRTLQDCYSWDVFHRSSPVKAECEFRGI